MYGSVLTLPQLISNQRGASYRNGFGRVKTLPYKRKQKTAPQRDGKYNDTDALCMNWLSGHPDKKYPIPYNETIPSGERWERRRWQEKRPERVAAVDRRRWHFNAKENVGHRNRYGK